MSQENLKWSSVRIFQSGDSYFQDLLFDIRHAKQKITIEVYIFELDPLTLMILEELQKARQRGCEVLLLIDGFGSYFWLTALEKEAQNRDLTLRVFRSMPRTMKWFTRRLWPYLFRWMGLLRKLNHRNHRKIILIDESIAYIGSINMTQVHSQKQMGDKFWKDTAARLTGGSIDDLNRAFTVAWQRAPNMGIRRLVHRRERDHKYRPRTSLVRLNATTWARFWLYRDLIKRIKTAKTRIWIETAYFLPKRSLLRALQKAAQRGVLVEIIIPFRTDVPIVKWAAEELIRTLIQKGVHVYEYLPHVLHSKFMIIDEWATLGSHNWNHRSFLHDMEVEAIFNEPQYVLQLSTDWQKDREQSLRLTDSDLKSHNFLRSWLGRLAFRLRYLL